MSIIQVTRGASYNTVGPPPGPSIVIPGASRLEFTITRAAQWEYGYGWRPSFYPRIFGQLFFSDPDLTEKLVSLDTGLYVGTHDLRVAYYRDNRPRTVVFRSVLFAYWTVFTAMAEWATPRDPQGQERPNQSIPFVVSVVPGGAVALGMSFVDE